MHGEYKTPGGKLVMADLDVREGRLKDVEVSGDFFLEPPEALSGITGALENAPADLAEEDLATTHDLDLRRAKYRKRANRRPPLARGACRG